MTSRSSIPRSPSTSSSTAAGLSVSGFSATVASRFARAAAVGLVAAACSKEEPAPAQPTEAAPAAAVAAPGGDKECCMGKNECKGKGGCAVPESNSCAGKNDCKGKGGCNMHCPKK